MLKFRVTTNGKRYRVESKEGGFFKKWVHVPFSGTYCSEELANDHKLRREEIQLKEIAQGSAVWRKVK